MCEKDILYFSCDLEGQDDGRNDQMRNNLYYYNNKNRLYHNKLYFLEFCEQIVLSQRNLSESVTNSLLDKFIFLLGENLGEKNIKMTKRILSLIEILSDDLLNPNIVYFF